MSIFQKTSFQKYSAFAILCFFSISWDPFSVHALSYDDGFMKPVQTACLSKEANWIRDFDGKYNPVIATPPTEKEYPRLDVMSVNASITAAMNIQSNNISTIASEIATLGSKSSQIVEIAKIHHREKMNQAFGSAILLSRLRILSDMRTALQSKMWSYSSEIGNKLEIETRKTESLLEQYGGKHTTEDKQMIRDRLLQTVMIQHCMYTQYLTYVDGNIEENYQGMINLEQQIRANTVYSGTSIPATITTARQSIESRQDVVRRELAKSENNLLKWIDAFMNMESTYAAHILLVIIYDDYLRLQRNLVKFLNPTSQYFEKSYNAQNVNQ